jgi:hypothetical protein
VQALSTQIAASTATLSAAPTGAPTQSVAESTPAPVSTTAPTASGAQPSATAEALPCDRAKFVDDITIPDGTVVAPGKVFTKTWELENVGSCTWNSNYAVVFANEGNAMNGPAAKQFTTGTVAPGERVKVSIDLTAPSTPGDYRGYWKLRNASGTTFGTGPSDSAFYVDIKVSGDMGSGPAYKLVDFYCMAEWRNGKNDLLSCPGKTTDEAGYIIKLDNPHLETGSTDDEPGLLTQPQKVENGEIRGTFPAITVATGSKFSAVIGCQYNATNCDVKFVLDYIVEGGTEQTLAEWIDKYDNAFNSVSIDLASLVGKKVQFILITRANGPATDDQAIWLQPRITQ